MIHRISHGIWHPNEISIFHILYLHFCFSLLSLLLPLLFLFPHFPFLPLDSCLILLLYLLLCLFIFSSPLLALLFLFSDFLLFLFLIHYFYSILYNYSQVFPFSLGLNFFFEFHSSTVQVLLSYFLFLVSPS